MKISKYFSLLNLAPFFFLIIFSSVFSVVHADENWQKIAKLMDEQKFNAAAKQVDVLLKKHKAAKNNKHWRQALVLGTTLRLRKDPIEETANYLMNQQWPSDSDSKLLLNLYLAKVLTQYIKQNHWQIHNREEIKTKKRISIEKKTIKQIKSDINIAFKSAYQLAQSRQNDSLNSLSLEGLNVKNTYFTTSNFPDNVRGGISDTIVYLWVNQLLDISLWGVNEQRNTAKLKLNELLSSSLSINHGDNKLHPLLRALSLINYLEKKEIKRNRPEAALEAFRMKIKSISQHLSQLKGGKDKKQLLKLLRARIDTEDKRFSWTNMLRNDLAQMIRSTNTPDANIRSVQVLKECLSLHNKQAVTRTCQTQLREIQKPHVSLSSMRVDGLNKRSVQISHSNTDKLYFRAWRLSKNEAITKNNRENIERLLKSNKKAHSIWETSLPPTKDYRVHKTYITPPLKTHGYWLIAASLKANFSIKDDKNLVVANAINISNLVVDTSTSDKKLIARVYKGETGHTVANVKVELWGREHRKPVKLIETKNTSRDGSAGFIQDTGRNYLMVAQQGNDFTIVDNMYGYYGGEHGSVSNSLVFTDRAIYRPGQKIKWKVIAYSGDSGTGKYSVSPAKKGTVTLFDANGKEVQKIDITSNQYGSASGEFTAKTGLLLGNWSIRTSFSGYKGIRVEEYKRPTFEAKIQNTKDSLRLNQWAQVTGSARYYFGQAVTDGNVKWRVERQAFTPWQHQYHGKRINALNVASGDVALNDKGEFLIKFMPKEVAFPKRTLGHTNKDIVHQYIITADITNAGGETRSVSKTLNIAKTSIRASIENNRTYSVAGEPFELNFTREDLDGTPRTGSGFWALQKIQQPKEIRLGHEIPMVIEKQNIPYATAGDKLKPRWESTGNSDAQIDRWKLSSVSQKGSLRHDDEGNVTLKLKIPQSGLYRLKYITKDKTGNIFEVSNNLTVAGKQNMSLMLPAVLKTQAKSVDVGKHAELLIGSGFAQTPYSLEVFHGNKLLKRQLFNGGIRQFKFPVRQEHQGGLSFVLTAVKDYGLFRKTESINVPWKSKNLNVTLSSFRDKLTPGEKETWRISVKDSNNKPLEKGAVEILASMYDRSLDLFGEHYPTSVASLYGFKRTDIQRFNNLSMMWSFYNKDYVLNDAFIGFDSARLNNFEYLNDSASSTSRHSQGTMPVVAAPMAAPAPAPVMAPKPQVDVFALQRKLKAAGYYKGPIDGKVDANTRAALQKYMKRDGDDAVGELVENNDSTSLENIKTRTNFNETAFFYPHLVLEDNGSVAFEFEVPESLTEWKVWVSAITKDLRGGDLSAYAKTTKELIVRPYLPRFLRSGDQANIEVLVNNTGEKPLTGKLDFDVLDPATKESLAKRFKLTNKERQFTVAAGQSSRLRFPIKAPKDLGVIAIRTRASASNGKDSFGDGEQRPLPVLPSRLYLSQSRFTALKAKSTKQLNFPELAKTNDPSLNHESLVVTIDGQLFYSALNALPYLVDYPYECTEQTLNRFLSTSIVSSVFSKHPALATLAKDMAKRDGRLDKWDEIDSDPNSKMLLEETPWLNHATGAKSIEKMQHILNPKVAKAQYQSALKKLRKAQNKSGAFPWWEGGRDSSYITAYLLQGFARALEFNVDIPKDMVQKAWSYLDKHYAKDFNQKVKNNTAEVVLMNYVLSSYPDKSWQGKAFNQNKRNLMLNQSFNKWKSLSPLSKAYLSLTLKRAGRVADAKLVFDSIMDAAKTTEELGTYWPKQNRSWYWYNDSLDTHAFMLRALMEIEPEDSRRHGLVQWLMMNKKLNHWKSTRATAESIYSLVHYLEKENQLNKDERVKINIGNTLSKTMTFKSNEYVGSNNKIVVKGADVKPDMANISASNQSDSLMFASANWHFSTEKLPAQAQGDFFKVNRSFFKRVKKGNDWQLQPLAEGATIAVGDQLEVQLTLFTENNAEFVHLRAPRGAGFEPESQQSGYRWANRTGYYEEIRDSGANYFFDSLPSGEYAFKYRLRASTAGQFRMAPASVQSVYAPEFNAYSSGQRLIIK